MSEDVALGTAEEKRNDAPATPGPATPHAEEAEPLALRPALEALLITLDASLVPADVAGALDVGEEEIDAALTELAVEYAAQGRGFALRRTAAGWRLHAIPAADGLLAKVVQGEHTVRLSNAALETLAVVAYQQPVGRSRVAAVRGVNVDAVMRTLLLRGLVQEVGIDESTGAVLYGTTPAFLDKVGIRSLADLPELAPLLPDLATANDMHDGIST
jgi:segregation and condensation protein B